MERFFFSEFGNEFKSGANVLHGKIVFLLDLIEGHAASEAAHNERHRHACAPNDGFAVADCRINDNAIVAIHKSINTGKTC